MKRKNLKLKAQSEDKKYIYGSLFLYSV